MVNAPALQNHNPNQDPEEQRVPPSLAEIVSEAETVLCQATTVFPFVLFPDDVIVSLTRIDIVKRPFLFSKQVYPILIKDLVTVDVSTNLLFGSLSFVLRFQEHIPPTVSYLWRSDALRLERVIAGLLAVYKEGVDLSHYSAEEILRDVLHIGDERSRTYKMTLSWVGASAWPRFKIYTSWL